MRLKRSHKFALSLAAACTIFIAAPISAQAVELEDGELSINTTVESLEKLQWWIEKLKTHPEQYKLNAQKARVMIKAIEAAIAHKDYLLPVEKDSRVQNVPAAGPSANQPAQQQLPMAAEQVKRASELARWYRAQAERVRKWFQEFPVDGYLEIAARKLDARADELELWVKDGTKAKPGTDSDSDLVRERDVLSIIVKNRALAKNARIFEFYDSAAEHLMLAAKGEELLNGGKKAMFGADFEPLMKATKRRVKQTMIALNLKAADISRTTGVTADHLFGRTLLNGGTPADLYEGRAQEAAQAGETYSGSLTQTALEKLAALDKEHKSKVVSGQKRDRAGAEAEPNKQDQSERKRPATEPHDGAE